MIGVTPYLLARSTLQLAISMNFAIQATLLLNAPKWRGVLPKSSIILFKSIMPYSEKFSKRFSSNICTALFKYLPPNIETIAVK